MTAWQKRARFAVALFGLVFAAFVYYALGDRQSAPVAAPVEREDRKAISETHGGQLLRLQGTRQDVKVEFEKILNYDDGTSRLSAIRISVTRRQPDGRDFVITAAEGEVVGKDEDKFELAGGVKLQASDGFQLATAEATYDRTTGVAETPGAVTFEKGGMKGSGTGMRYDHMVDVLEILADAVVTMTDANGKTTLDFRAGTATLDRLQNFLEIEGNARVLRDEQVFEANRANALLTENEEAVTYIQLRGNARVTGGPSIQSMAAHDIDLNYTDDGAALEQVVLTGASSIAMKTASGAPGREITGETMDLMLAPDGALTRALVRRNVRLTLPAAEGTPARAITAGTLDGNGKEGAGLTDAVFTGDVQFSEGAERNGEARVTSGGSAGPALRVVRAQRLQLGLNGDAVSTADFSGMVTFEEQGLRAGAAIANYHPGKGTLGLRGSDSAGGPCVADEQIAVDAPAIDITLETRAMTASSGVRTTMRGAPGCTRAASRSGSAQGRSTGAGAGGRAGRGASGQSRLPGLLNEKEQVVVTANMLTYDAGGEIVYSGSAVLMQGDTTMRANAITIDQDEGNLVATGNATSIMMIDGARSDGSAHEIRYDDAKRVVSFSVPASPRPARGGRGAAAPPAAPPPAPAAPPAGRGAVPRVARVVGAQGDLQAETIDVHLAKEGGTVERLEAAMGVVLNVDNTRQATATRLTYHAAESKYELRGEPGAPVSLVERGASCRETRGTTLTFFKGTDRIIVDGNEDRRTQTKNTGPCAPSPAPRR